MEENFKRILESVYLQCDRLLEDLTEAHHKNLELLEIAYNNAVGKIIHQKTKLDEIISFLVNPSPHWYFPNIALISMFSDEDLKMEQDKWEVGSIEKSTVPNDIYTIKECEELKKWEKARVKECEHQLREIIVTYCKQPHCKECLKKLILNRIFKCECGKALSPKNQHEIMGFDFKVI